MQKFILLLKNKKQYLKVMEKLNLIEKENPTWRDLFLDMLD